MTHREIFSRIYREKVWGDGSGGGSTPGASGPWAAIATAVIGHTNAKTVLDIGCGDGWASSQIYFAGTKYIGIDPVQSMINYCREKHSHGEFLCLDAITEPLPNADLVLLKEVTQHLSDESVVALLDKLRRYQAVLHCSALTGGQIRATDGGYRPVRLSLPPFNLITVDLSSWKFGETEYQAELWRPKACV